MRISDWSSDVCSSDLRLIQQRRLGYSSISRMIGRNSSYIQQFIKRGSPRKLDDDDRRTLASFFGVDEQVLGGPPAPMRDGLIEIPVLNVDASADRKSTRLNSSH